MDLLPFFQWCYDTSVGEAIRNSTWLFPLIEAFHLLGFALTVGAVLFVDLRLLGAGLRKQSPAELSAGAQPWLIGSLILMFASGIPLFLCESIKCYYSFPFWVKMGSLALATIFTFTVLRRVVQKMRPRTDRLQVDWRRSRRSSCGLASPGADAG